MRKISSSDFKIQLHWNHTRAKTYSPITSIHATNRRYPCTIVSQIAIHRLTRMRSKNISRPAASGQRCVSTSLLETDSSTQSTSVHVEIRLRGSEERCWPAINSVTSQVDGREPRSGSLFLGFQPWNHGSRRFLPRRGSFPREISAAINSTPADRSLE